MFSSLERCSLLKVLQQGIGELLIRNACLINEIESLIPKIEPVLEPLRKYVLVAAVFGAERG